MAFDRWMIAPFDEGLETDLRPWLIPESAFTELNNAYIFRGRVRKRFGSTYIGGSEFKSRLRIDLGINPGGGVWAGNVPGVIWKVGQAFSVGAVKFVVHSNVAGPQQMYRTDGSVEAATYDITTGAYAITMAAAGPADILYFYPTEPVMGLTQFSTSNVLNQPAYAFDTQFAYKYTNAWNRAGAAVWNGNDTNFFWAENWTSVANQKLMFVTNYQVTNKNGAIVATDDPLRYWNDVNWTDFYPYFMPAGGAIGTGPYVASARLIIAFKNRLLFLNTIETDAAQVNNIHYQSRCRFSHNGSPLATNAWYEPNQTDAAGNIADGGGWIDASTDEEIVAAEFIKDRLIVYFERSTWELAYTGNQVLPFVWQKLNTELGSEAPFSTVPFDKVVLTVGNTGIHACNGSNVERIDVKIPDEVFKIKDLNTDVVRVHGIRDYYTEMVYWTIPSSNAPANVKYPNRVLVYNYKNDTWAYNDDCITTFGYFEQQTGPTWASSPQPWATQGFTWNSGTAQSQFRQIIAGNPEGFVYIIDSNIPVNESVWQVTDVADYGGMSVDLRIVDGSFQVGEWIKVNDPLNTSGLDGQIFKIEVADNVNFLYNISADTTGAVYTGSATVERVSQLWISSKQWNPYVKQGRNLQLSKIDFAVLKTTAGEVNVDYSTSSTSLSMNDEVDASNSDVGDFTGTLSTAPYALKPLENLQERLWHPVYFQAEGEFIQITISLTDRQMKLPAVVESTFELEGMILHTRPTTNVME